jgi:hypothetical protein
MGRGAGTASGNIRVRYPCRPSEAPHQTPLHAPRRCNRARVPLPLPRVSTVQAWGKREASRLIGSSELPSPRKWERDGEAGVRGTASSIIQGARVTGTLSPRLQAMGEATTKLPRDHALSRPFNRPQDLQYSLQLFV